MSPLINVITSADPAVRNQSLEAFCQTASFEQLIAACTDLDHFRRISVNLYERVRAHFFLYAIHRFHLPFRPQLPSAGLIPFEATSHLLKRRFEEAIEILLRAAASGSFNTALCSALAAAYRGLAFKTLADQVRQSVRSVRGNQWMSRIGHPDDYPLALHPRLLQKTAVYPILREATPVRMDLTHSAWSDIFFLGMDYPEGAQVINVSVDLAIHGQGSAMPQPPVEAYIRVIEEPIIRLTSVDLNSTADLTTFAELFDFGRDYLGLLKAAVIASGLVPPAMEGAVQPLSNLLTRLVGPGLGIELVSRVRDIPKGSRLAVSTNLLAGLISVCMRATRQISSLTGPLNESDRRLVLARAVLGEWLGGSGGGWQDSGGVWPGIKLICGAQATEQDSEWGISRGRLMPTHQVFSSHQISDQTRQCLQDSLVLVHGGMAQDVGPILEMVTEKYLLRSEAEWSSRQDALSVIDEILDDLQSGDIRALGAATERNFFGPIQSIIPWATNSYTETLIHRARSEMQSSFWGFWMLGGMAGGGMGFIFDPRHKQHAQARMQAIMLETKRRLEHAVPFAMDPVVYDFAINENGTFADILTGESALLPEPYYAFIVPRLLRMEPRAVSADRRAELEQLGAACRREPALSGIVQTLFDRLLPGAQKSTETDARPLRELLKEYGFDSVAHEQIRTDLRNGRIGLAQNRLHSTTQITDVCLSDVTDCRSLRGNSENGGSGLKQLGLEALRHGAVAVVSLAGGAGTRWTKGAGVVKAINPFAKFAGQHRNFIELHLAKTCRTSRLTVAAIPHVITTSYLTHDSIAAELGKSSNYGYTGPVLLSPGRSIGLRLIPTVRDLRFAWEETTQQELDQQKQKVRESGRAALIQWAQHAGEGTDYTDNLPSQCLHPTGHWYEISNMLRNGTLASLLKSHPNLRYMMTHNIDTLGADLDPAILGAHIAGAAALSFEVISRQVEDHGGGLARVDGRLRLVEGLALPSEELESALSFYNSNTTWISISQLLEAFGLTQADLDDHARVTEAVRTLAARMPTYITLKDVKKRWGKGQEDIYPVAQFEKLFVDMSALSDLQSRFLVVSRRRGQQLKEPAQLDGWLRDGSAAYVNSLCDWPKVSNN